MWIINNYKQLANIFYFRHGCLVMKRIVTKKAFCVVNEKINHI